jgi:Dockerin type I domain
MAFFDLLKNFQLAPCGRKRLFSRRVSSLEALEGRSMLAADWQNPINPLDVDGQDGPDPVTPRDALLVINELTSRRHSDRETGSLPSLHPGTQPPPFLDVNGNGFLSALDALLVINALPTSAPPSTDDLGAPDTVISGTRAALAAGVTADSRVNTETKRLQSFPELAAGGNQLIVTWSSWDQDGSDWGIYGQRYDAFGAKLGGEFRINTTTRFAQRDSRVAIDAQGRFVVLWQSLHQDGGSWGVYARMYQADGTPSTGEILVNTGVTTGSQIRPDVSFLSTGQIVVTFEGRSGSDNDGIHAKILNFDGSNVIDLSR